MSGGGVSGGGVSGGVSDGGSAPADVPAEAQIAPAAARNRGFIEAMLRDWLPRPGLVLEVASGTGEHATWFSQALPDVTWQPTDRDADRLTSIAAWRAQANSPNLRPPLLLDAAAPLTWPPTPVDAVVAINMIHIAPWAATLGLMNGAARVLRPGGVLVLYGPFREADVPLSDSNAAFDASLRERDAAWGLRDLAAVEAVAAGCGLTRVARLAMPACNLGVVFRQG